MHVVDQLGQYLQRNTCFIPNKDIHPCGGGGGLSMSLGTRVLGQVGVYVPVCVVPLHKEIKPECIYLWYACILYQAIWTCICKWVFMSMRVCTRVHWIS